MLSLLFASLCVLTVPALSADEPLKPKHTKARRSMLYITEVMIPDGKQFQVSCPREQPFDKTNAYKNIVIVGGRYSSDFANNGTEICKDTIVTKNLATQCKDKSKCAVSAKDLSTEKSCKKRTLRLRYQCRNPDTSVAVELCAE